jgi:hypothetical protein
MHGDFCFCCRVVRRTVIETQRETELGETKVEDSLLWGMCVM